MSQSEKERFGKSAMVRYVSGIDQPIYPIAYIKNKIPMAKKAAVCSYTADGRALIHTNLSLNPFVLNGLRNQPSFGRSTKLTDSRISLFSAQRGKCALCGELFENALYMATLGNRPDLFPDSDYIQKHLIDSYTDYDIPPEELENTKFAAMIKEAEKYLGYPYVWGGSSPSTSFDCSGFVSWVVNHSGWNVGRLSAQGLYNVCTPVSRSNARPGDLVFFKGTYKTNGVSHVGIYVGNNKMIHCGDPISYTNINTQYWQSHFYAYGRLP